MTTDNFGTGFFRRAHFDKNARKKFQEKWSAMTNEEKLDFMNKKVENMGKDFFSAELIDARCDEWMKKTPEEKEAFVSERKKAFQERTECGSAPHGHPFGFSFFGKHPME